RIGSPGNERETNGSKAVGRLRGKRLRGGPTRVKVRSPIRRDQESARHPPRRRCRVIGSLAALLDTELTRRLASARRSLLQNDPPLEGTRSRSRGPASAPAPRRRGKAKRYASTRYLRSSSP